LTEAARKVKAAELTAYRISEQILAEGLGEGSVLPHERAMAEDLGVGRGTLREALRLLETQGVIRIKPGPGGGPVVRRPRPDDLVGAMSMLLQFLGASLNEVATTREALEAASARAAAGHATADQIEQLQASVDRMRSHRTDDTVLYAENERFHRLLAAMSGNTVLLVIGQTLERLNAGAARTLAYSPQTRSAIADAHQRVVDAIRAGDPDAAEAAARQHLIEFHRYVALRNGALLAAPIRWSPDQS
jgi:DNA-binding FadR family transcriptional regulator